MTSHPSTVRSGRFSFPSAKQISVVEAIAVHARKSPYKDKLQGETLECAALPVTVYIEAATPWALTNA
jgi:hypothetical protein